VVYEARAMLVPVTTSWRVFGLLMEETTSRCEG